MATHSSVLVVESSKNPHGQRSLADYSREGHKQLDLIERLSIGYRQILDIIFQIFKKIFILY